MRRTWWDCAFSAVMALWLALSLSEPAFLHACPLHNAGGGHAESGASDHAAHGSHAMAHAASSAERSPASHAPDESSHDQCSCLGHCSSSAAAGMASTEIVLTETVAAATRDSGLEDHAYVPVAAKHVLPYQIGPPPAL